MDTTDIFGFRVCCRERRTNRRQSIASDSMTFGPQPLQEAISIRSGASVHAGPSCRRIDESCFNQARKPRGKMDNMETRQTRRQGGYVMISAMALTLILIAMGAAFMQWASDEAQQSQESLGGMQAYYCAQAGVIEKGLTWLRTQQAGLLPQSETSWTESYPVVVDNKTIGRYENVRIAPIFGGLEGSTSFFSRRQYGISAIGKAYVPWWDESGQPIQAEVVRKAVLYVSVRSFADYMYLTDHEVTPLGEMVRFFSGDTLWGRTHSNDTITIMTSPVFYSVVSTGADRFGRGTGYNPQFLGPDPYFNAPKVEIPLVASTVREGAHRQARFFERDGYEFRILFRGSIAKLFEWEEGAPFDSLTAQQTNITGGDQTCIFIAGPLSVAGVVSGSWTIGCSKDIYLIDNIRYTCLNLNTFMIPPDCNDYLGLVSETRVIIANTWENGRENQAQGQDIIINAAIVALGDTTGSFTFDQQNDIWDAYIGPNPDERGQIHLNGSVTQRFRGYVHRSNQGGTGYLKDYKYDDRFLTQRPPCFMDAVDQSGRALFDIVQWGQAVEKPEDIRANRRVLYN
jgi:hypothetical protein